MATAAVRAPLRVGIYARISSDREGDQLGVQRQIADCERIAQQRGWVVAERYVDDDISAWSGKRRPEFERLLADLRAGAVRGVLVYHLDRLTRGDLRVLESFVDLCDELRVELGCVTGDVDLATSTGRLTARMLGSLARYESDHKSERIRRKHEEIAANGRVSGGGSRPYGYEADKLTVRAAEAAIVRECAKRLLAGEPVLSIVRDLNERGVMSASGGVWSPQSLRRILASPRISGQRTHHGQIVAKAVWPAIIGAKDGAKIRALLANPERRTNKAARRYLLGGLLVCSHCGERLVARPRSGGQRRYACAKGPGFSGCGKTYINADNVERFVTEAVLIRLDSAALQRALERRQRKAPDAQRWLSELEQAQAQQVELAAAYGNREISMDELRAARKPIEARLTNARKQLAKLSRSSVLDRYIGNGDALRADWDSLDLSQQHALVAAVVDSIRVGPARRGYNRFDESRLTPVWRP
ncbi:MAG TPA: recombinase family protein [Solirubrobacteraceae bacterium]|nr:recombinase family protein [Solirubrobacteraceae bacterium]